MVLDDTGKDSRITCMAFSAFLKSGCPGTYHVEAHLSSRSGPGGLGLVVVQSSQFCGSSRRAWPILGEDQGRAILHSLLSPAHNPLDPSGHIAGGSP